MFRLSLSIAAFILIAGLGPQEVPAFVSASLYESRIIGITFPADTTQAATRLQQQQQQQPQLQLPKSAQQLQFSIDSAQPPRRDSSKRTLLLKGLRSGQVAVQNISPYGNSLATLWDNTKTYRAPSAQASRKYSAPLGLRFPQNGLDAASSLPYVLNGYGVAGAASAGAGVGNYALGPQLGQQQRRNHHRAGSEEIALHTPIHSHSSSDYEWKRVENSRWNNLRGMWGKRADVSASRGVEGSVGGVGGVGVDTAASLEERFKNLIELLSARDEKALTEQQQPQQPQQPHQQRQPSAPRLQHSDEPEGHTSALDGDVDPVVESTDSD